MAANEGANRDFVPVDVPAEALALLLQGAKHAAASTLWTQNQERLIKSHFSALTDNQKTMTFWLPTGTNVDELLVEVRLKNLKDWFFSVSLPAANIFFKARWLGVDSAGMRFAVPEKLFKVQRRKDFRFSIPDGYVLKIEFADPLIPDARIGFKVLDLSGGGLSFLVRPDEAPLFPPGAVLKELSLKVKGREVRCSAEVRHLRELPLDSRTKGVKVGVQFSTLSAADTQAIATYVFDETRKFVSKML
ncbi:MAG: PilZ domain-containing protein [Bdellovibrionales bacterium]|nr:PilZ domain-containing protein [Bdellovibrionales bacterium]